MTKEGRVKEKIQESKDSGRLQERDERKNQLQLAVWLQENFGEQKQITEVVKLLCYGQNTSENLQKCSSKETEELKIKS